MGKLHTVQGKFKKDCRLHIGITDGLTVRCKGLLDNLLWTSGVPGCMFRGKSFGLRDGKILTMFTGKITAHGGDGKRLTSREEMKKRLFFYRINIFSNNPSIDKGIELSISILPYPAQPSFPIGNGTTVRTEVTTDMPTIFFTVEKSLMHKITHNKQKTSGKKSLITASRKLESEIPQSIDTRQQTYSLRGTRQGAYGVTRQDVQNQEV